MVFDLAVPDPRRTGDEVTSVSGHSFGAGSVDVLGVTGHRPDKLGGFSDKAQHKVYLYARERLRELSPNLVLTGMAQGWDIAIGLACINLGLDFIAYVPFEGQELMWPGAAQKEYHHILSFAQSVKIISKGGYAPSKMMARNLAVVDDCDVLLALWNGDRTGGTWNAVETALEVNHPIINAWDGWKEFRKSA